MTDHDRTVTALNILDGMEHADHLDALQPTWEHDGMGFIEMCVWISEVAADAVTALEARNPQDFPGVWDYEVSYTVGEMITQHAASTGMLPSKEEVLRWFSINSDEFFAQEN